MDNILLYPNIELPGIVYPAQITSFGVTTSIEPSSGNPTEIATLRLYWDVYFCACL